MYSMHPVYRHMALHCEATNEEDALVVMGAWQHYQRGSLEEKAATIHCLKHNISKGTRIMMPYGGAAIWGKVKEHDKD